MQAAIRLRPASSCRREPLPQLRPPPLPPVCPHGDGERAPLPDDHDKALAARDRRVDEVARQHRVVLGREGDDNGGIFGALRLVDRRRIGGNQRVEFAERIFDLAPVELDPQVALGLIDAENAPEIAVEHLAVVVVFRLHHLIAGREA